MVKNKTQEEIKSNALLIAAAPELLAACEKTLEQAGLSVDSPCYVILSAAIAKAKDHKRAKKRYWEANTENL